MRWVRFDSSDCSSVCATLASEHDTKSTAGRKGWSPASRHDLDQSLSSISASLSHLAQTTSDNRGRAWREKLHQLEAGLQAEIHANKPAVSEPAHKLRTGQKGCAPSPQACRILVAAAMPLLQKGIRTLLEPEGDLHVRGEATDGEAALRFLKSGQFDLAILEWSLPGRSGLEVLIEVRKLQLALPIILLSPRSDVGSLHLAIQAGANGYVWEYGAPSELIEAVRAVRATGHFISHLLAESALFQGTDTPTENQLSPREREVLDALKRDRSTKEIAGELGTSERTVMTYYGRICFKLRLANNHELRRYAWGLVGHSG
jgi:DNA-binding NarL/FixJ family response regulator